MSFLGNPSGFCVEKNRDYICSFIFESNYFQKKFNNIDIFDKNILGDGVKISKVDRLKPFKAMNLATFRKIKVKEIRDRYPVRFIIKSSHKIFENNVQKFIKHESDFFYFEIKKGEYSKKNNSLNINKKENDSFELTEKIDNTVLDFVKQHNIKSVSDAVDKVYKNFKYEDISKELSISEIFKNKKGDCTEYSIALNQILKAISIKSKIVYGIIYQNGYYSFHAWVEYFDGEGWVAIDPSFNRFQLDPFWIKLTENRADLQKFLGMSLEIKENY